MKKRLLSVFLVACMLLTMFSGTAWAAEETNVTVIRIPGSNATFTLENANSEYGILANLSETLSYCGGTLSFGPSSAPTYVFTFPGEDGRITCDTPAYVDSCGAYFMGDSGEICAGGGDREESGTWQAYYDLKPYVGHSCTLVNIYADGSLNAPYGSEIIATVLFAFGYPVDDGASDDLLPNEADRYLLSEWTNSAQCGENLTWTLDSEGTLNISGTGAMWDWSITDTRPWEDSWSDIKTVVIGAGVTHIGNYAFRSCIGLERVEMPDGLLTIGNHAFAQCYDLTNVEIPDSVHSIDWGAFELCQALSELHIGSGVTSIGSGAFSRCYSLTSVEIPSGLSAIPDSAFSNCSNLASVEIPDGITSIGGYAFYHSTSDNQALKNIIIPASVTEIGAAVFDGCTELTDIYYTGSEAQWKLVNINSDNEQLFAATLHFEASGTAGLEYTLLDDGTYEVSGIGSTSGQHIVIPAAHNGTAVSSIGEEAFKSCTSIVSVKIPDGVTSIGQGAFYGCLNLESVELPKGITTIPNNLFYECSSLKQIVIPDNVTSIGDYAFLGCYALPDITIPYGVTEIGREAFANCHSFEDITIPGSVQDFGTSVFGTCENLKHVTFCDGVTTVGNGMFSGCENLSSITFADSITKIGRSAFQMCSSLTNLELPGSVEHIGYGAFHWCDHLSSLTVPNAEVVFEPTDVYGIKTFALCKALEDVYFGGTEAQWIASGGHSALAEANISPTVHYSEEKAVASGVLRSGEDWSINWSVSYTIDNDSGIISDGALKIEAIGSGEESDLYIFNGTGTGFPWESEPYNIPKIAIKSIDIRGNLAVDLRVTTNAFKGYSNLKTLNCSFISGIDSSAFEGCNSLTTVKIAYAGDAFSYGAKVFKDCTKLNSVEFPSSLTNIGDSAFQNTALSGKITLGSNIAKIGTDAFSGCNDLTIRCYEGSVAHQYAVSNNIPFELISEETFDVTVDLSNGEKTIGLEINWNPNAFFSEDSTNYNNDLAIASLALSAAAYGGTSAINKTLSDLGFKEGSRWHDNYNNPGSAIPAYSIASRQITVNGQEKTLIALIVRGTNTFDDVLTDIRALADGFTIASNYISSTLSRYIGVTYPHDDIIVFTTGHSLGAAVAGRVAADFSSQISNAKVFSYTFATPHNAAIWDALGADRSNIHNIINGADVVPALPPNYLRFGQDRYCISSNNTKFAHKYMQLFDSYPDIYNPFNLADPHMADTYMALLLSDEPLSVTTQYGYRLVRVLCPVDVRVYDSTGKLVGQVTNNQVDESLLTNEVFICTMDDEKYIYLMNDDAYTFKLTGTDDGTMNYSVQDIAIDGTVLQEKEYKNVALSQGKEMSSNAGGTTDTPDVPLYVLGKNDEPVKTVLPDGKGTEVPISQPSVPGYSGGGGNYTPSYSISVPNNFAGGTVSIDSSHAKAGATVTITVTPDEGYKLSRMVVTDAKGNELDLVNESNGRYSFKMPSEKVNVEVRFKEAPKNPFTDVTTDSWFYDAAMFVYERGLMNGIGADLFGPDIATTRGMLVTILWRQDGAPEAVYDGELNDVPDTMYYAPAVKWAAANGIMGGYGDGKFGPDDLITREQMAAILWRYAQYKGYDVSVTEDSISDFNDVSAISNYAVPAMQWVCSEGIMSGKPGKILDPTGTAKRSEIAAMLMRFLENVK